MPRHHASPVHVGSVDGRQVAICCAVNGDLHILDLRTGETLGIAMYRSAKPPSVMDLGEIHGRPLLATGSDDRTVRIWDPRTFVQLALIDVGVAVTAVKFAPDHAVIVGTVNGLMRIELDQIAAETNA